MQDTHIAFIGGGNMALSLIGGLIADGFNPEHIHVADPQAEQRATIQQQYGVVTYQDNLSAINQCEIIVLAVKPQQCQQVLKQLAPHWQINHLLISIAAGIRTQDMVRWLEQTDAAIVRTMPNTPALVQAGATGLFANTAVNDLQQEQAESILRACGITLWVEQETELDIVTALSGSGPAYFFLVMEAMEAAAIKLGLSPQATTLLCTQTAFGAAKMALESDDNAATLRHKVTSPGGTTERALHELQDGDLSGLFENALVAAALRARELASQLGEDNAD